jgi:hypothetical protein
MTTSGYTAPPPRAADRISTTSGDANLPNLPAEADWVKSGSVFPLVPHSKISSFSLGGRDVADGFKKTSMIKPINPFGGGELDRLQ